MCSKEKRQVLVNLDGRMGIMNKNFIYKDLVLILFVYTVSQWLLLVVSGYWWDDSVLIIRNETEIAELYNSTGVVFSKQLAAVMCYFQSSYRYVTFALGLIIVLLIYFTLLNMKVFSCNECFWISILFVSIPINDAKITWICFPYTICLGLFFGAFYLVTLWRNKNRLAWLWRFLSWCLLVFSYNINSLLVFSGLILLYLYYEDYIERFYVSSKRTVWDFWHIILRNIDYVLIPCAYFLVKVMFFKPYGPYVGYNAVNIKTIIHAIIKLPVAMINSGSNIFANYYSLLRGLPGKFCIMVIICLLFVIYVKKRYGSWKKIVTIDGDKKYSLKNHKDDFTVISIFFENRDIKILLLGIFAFALGVFPYMVVGRMSGVASVGVAGRDSALLGLGCAICIFAFGRILLSKALRNCVYGLLVTLGVLHFNNWYLNYQQEWYQEMEFMQEVSKNERIKNNDTFWVAFRYPTPCGTDSFYNMNVNSYKCLGDQTRFFTTKLGYIADKNIEMFANYYGMDDYNKNNMDIDGIVLFDNRPFSKKQLLKLKWNEMFKQDDFINDIKRHNRIEYIAVSHDESRRILNAYKMHNFTQSDFLAYIRIKKFLKA